MKNPMNKLQVKRLLEMAIFGVICFDFTEIGPYESNKGFSRKGLSFREKLFTSANCKC
jgi:hypothetical protein